MKTSNALLVSSITASLWDKPAKRNNNERRQQIQERHTHVVQYINESSYLFCDNTFDNNNFPLCQEYCSL